MSLKGICGLYVYRTDAVLMRNIVGGLHIEQWQGGKSFSGAHQPVILVINYPRNSRGKSSYEEFKQGKNREETDFMVKPGNFNVIALFECWAREMKCH